MANQPRIEKCLFCGKDNPQNRRQFCCDQCQRMYNSQKNRKPRICEACGKQFFADYNQRYRKYCSDECREWGAEQSRIKERNRATDRRFRQKSHTKKNKLLSLDALEAQKAGLSYGQWQAMKYMGKEVVADGR